MLPPISRRINMKDCIIIGAFGIWLKVLALSSAGHAFVAFTPTVTNMEVSAFGQSMAVC
jgi:hypothetical protein